MALRRLSGAIPGFRSLAGEDRSRSRETNDSILRRAIVYVTNEGGSDSPETFADKVQRIDDSIIQGFRRPGRSFDAKLYQHLRKLVQEVQNDHRRITEEKSASDPNDANIEELHAPDALYRTIEDADSPQSPVRRNTRFSSPTSSQLREAKVRKTQFLYGGPNNEPEEWHDVVPADFVFGEGPKMEKWESMKVRQDLTRSAKGSASNSGASTSKLPYLALANHFARKDQYDSGSSFKLPSIADNAWDQMKRVTGSLPFWKVAEEFNRGGVVRQHLEKDYAPRIFLPQVDTWVRRVALWKPDAIGQPLKSTSTRHFPNLQISYHTDSHVGSRRLSGPSDPPMTKRTGTIHPEVLPRIRKPPRQACISSPDIIKVRPLTPPQKPRRVLKAFEERRKEVLNRAAAETATQPGPSTITRRRSVAEATSTRPITSHLSHIALPAPVICRPGRPPTNLIAAPASSPSETNAPQKGKRILEDPDGSYTESTKRAKTAMELGAEKCSVQEPPAAKPGAPKRPAKKPIPTKPTAKKTVVFAAKESPSAAQTYPRRATSKKSILRSDGNKPAAAKRAAKKPASKRASRKVASVPEYPKVPKSTTEGYQNMKRGVTRSGLKFKS